MADDAPDQGKRSRSRRNVIASSAHREEYHKLLQNGWSATALMRFAWYRYGEDIPVQTVRAYRRRHNMEILKSPTRGKDVDPDVILDILQERAELVQLQKDRIAIDTAHERAMNKLFGSTRHEIDALNRLLNDAKTDMQDFGLFPKLGEVHNVRIAGALAGLTPGAGDPPADDGRGHAHAPRHRTLGDLLAAGGDEVPPDAELQLARMLHELMPAVEDPQVNGGSVVDGDVEQAG